MGVAKDSREQEDVWLILASHVPALADRGGMVRYTVEVTGALLRAGVRVAVHCQPSAVGAFAGLGVAAPDLHPHAHHFGLRNALGERYGLKATLAAVRPRVILGTKHLVPRRSPGAIRVLTVHDMMPFDRPQDFGTAKRLLLPQPYLRSLLDADVLACVSEATRKRLVARAPSTADRAVVIPNAMTPSLQHATAQPLAPLAGRRFILAVGDPSPRKNLRHLIGLWSAVEARVPGAHLAVVGPPGWGRAGDLTGLDALVARGAASLHGRVSDGELRWAYEHAAALACPSLLEGFGLPVVEAAAFGCPAIISQDAALVEAGAGWAESYPLTDAEAWCRALASALAAGGGASRVRPRHPVRTWDDVAAELIAATASVRVEAALR